MFWILIYKFGDIFVTVSKWLELNFGLYRLSYGKNGFVLLKVGFQEQIYNVKWELTVRPQHSII